MGGSHHLHLCFPIGVTLESTLGYCLASFSIFLHWQYNNGAIKHYHKRQQINTLYIHHLSHITTLYLIALLHYSLSHPISLTANPHGTLVPPWCFVQEVLHNFLPVWPGNLNLPLLYQYAQTPRTCSIQPINQLLHVGSLILELTFCGPPQISSHLAPCIRWLITHTLRNRPY